MNIIIRNESQPDIETISVITKAAFEKLPISNHTEQFIINALRNANALTIYLVAEMEKKAVGHIVFSPVTISDGSLHWYGLGPISVLPGLQKRGIGKSLMGEGRDQGRPSCPPSNPFHRRCFNHLLLCNALGR